MNCLIYIPKCLAASVGNLNDCGSNDRVAELIALCEHFDDNILADILILDMHDSRVDVRVERVALGAERLNVERFENIAELPVYLLDSLAVAVGIRLSVHRRALKIIYDREKLLDDIRFRADFYVVLLAQRTLAEVIVFRREAQEVVGTLLE